MQPARPPQGIARFELLQPLGQGGMGTVFEARERGSGARVALKMLHGREGATLYRFKQEFRALQEVSHPNVVRFGELFADGGRFYLTMELVEGENLLDYVRPGGGGEPVRTSAPTTSVHSRAVAVETQRLGVNAADETLSDEESAQDHSDTHDGTLDVERLRLVLRQLASGLCALHAAGLVHRDVKPHNVLVTREQRLVLLDFGLAIDPEDRDSAGRELVGTVAYMAPEQVEPQDVSAAADWYAFGVVLYEALTGRLPFRGHSLHTLVQKHTKPPVAPSYYSAGLPEDLCELCLALLNADPTQRPGDDEIARRLGLDATAERSRASFRSRLQFSRGTFVGRQAELAVLHAQSERARAQGCVVVRVVGGSGVGKSALMRRFAEELGGRARESIVLSGRCYEREAVPYRGVDSLVDALARHLRARHERGQYVFVPRRAGLLGQVFPVLRGLPQFARAEPSRLSELDPFEARRLGLSALRELLAELGDEAPLLLHVDDAQWLDAESAQLLESLVHGEDSPHMLLVLAQRPEAGVVAEPLRVLLQAAPPSTTLTLGPLSPADSQRLAAELSSSRHERGIDTLAVALHSGGHPLFIHELVMHGAGVANDQTPSLEHALGSRIATLPAECHRLLQLVCVAAAPLRHDVARAAAQLDAHAYPWLLSTLRGESLVTFHELGPDAEVQAYHDRIRELLLSRMDAPARKLAHEHIAEAMRTHTPDALDALAHHFLLADRRDTAAQYAIAAADRALGQLAFARAAELLRLALEVVRDDELRATLEERLGGALANAGHGPEAADAFERAASAASTASGRHSLELQRRAAEQWLRSGHLERGLSIVTRVLAELGEQVPRSGPGTLASLAAGLLRLRLRGSSFGLQAPRTLTPDEQLRLSTLWTVAAALSMMDTLNATAFQVRHLLLALELGQREQSIKGMAVLAATLSLVDGSSRRFAMRLLATAHETASAVSSAEIEGWIALDAGIAALSTGDFRAAELSCAHAEASFRDRCTGVAWELVTARAFLLWSSCYQGRLQQIAELLPSIVEQARARGDRYALSTLTLGPLHMVGLAADEPERVRRECEAELPMWSAPSAYFQRMCGLFMLAQADLYEGRAQEAWERLDAEWGTLKHTMALRVQFYRVDFSCLRARVALALAAQRPAQRAQWLARARSGATALGREGLGFARALATLLEVDLAHQEADAQLAQRLLTRARVELDAQGMAMHAALSSLAHARVCGDLGATARAEAELGALGVRACGRMLGLWLPGLSQLPA